MEKEINKEVPLGIKIISVLGMIFSAPIVLLGVFFSLASLCIIDLSIPFLSSGCNPSGLLFIFSLFFTLIGIFTSILLVFLWKGKKWSLILTKIILILYLIISLVIIFLYFSGSSFNFNLENIFGVLLYVFYPIITLIYLFMSKKVKEYFK